MAALRINVFIAVDELAAGFVGSLHGDPKSAGMTEMQITRWRGGDASAVL
jgi:hypothetical protein